MQQMVNELDKRTVEKLSQFEDQLKKDSDHKLMCISLINILDERANGLETRLVSVEKLTKEIHSSVQKYKAVRPAAATNNYGFEKSTNEKFDALNAEMVRFQEGIKIKLLELGTSIDVKCKKVVESKLLLLD
jgi:SMC interacting uncharacterized protein involved in chromosome segregation